VTARGPIAAWFLAGCGLTAAALCGYLAARGWDPTALLHVGEDSPCRSLLDRELGGVMVRPGFNHDGKYFYLIARRPWVWSADPETRAGLQDPAYRYGRPLYPMLAGLGGTLPPRTTLAGLIAVQVLAGGVFVAATVALARRNRLPTLAVAVGLLNPGASSSAVLLTSDLLALALCLTGVYLWQTGRTRSSPLVFAAALLAKEYYALTPLALAASLVWQRRWGAALAVGTLPLIPLIAWRLLVLAAVGPGEGAGNLGWPGVGIVEGAAHWDEPALGALAVMVLVAMLAAVVRPSPPLPRWQCVAWGLLGLTASWLVWSEPVNLMRVLAPGWWFAVWCWSPRHQDQGLSRRQTDLTGRDRLPSEGNE
jgi:hypothetical protein